MQLKFLNDPPNIYYNQSPGIKTFNLKVRLTDLCEGIGKASKDIPIAVQLIYKEQSEVECDQSILIVTGDLYLDENYEREFAVRVMEVSNSSRHKKHGAFCIKVSLECTCQKSSSCSCFWRRLSGPETFKCISKPFKVMSKLPKRLLPCNNEKNQLAAVPLESQAATDTVSKATSSSRTLRLRNPRIAPKSSYNNASSDIVPLWTKDVIKILKWLSWRSKNGGSIPTTSKNKNNKKKKKKQQDSGEKNIFECALCGCVGNEESSPKHYPSCVGAFLLQTSPRVLKNITNMAPRHTTTTQQVELLVEQQVLDNNNKTTTKLVRDSSPGTNASIQSKKNESCSNDNNTMIVCHDDLDKKNLRLTRSQSRSIAKQLKSRNQSRSRSNERVVKEQQQHQLQRPSLRREKRKGYNDNSPPLQTQTFKRHKSTSIAGLSTNNNSASNHIDNNTNNNMYNLALSSANVKTRNSVVVESNTIDMEDSIHNLQLEDEINRELFHKVDDTAVCCDITMNTVATCSCSPDLQNSPDNNNTNNSITIHSRTTSSGSLVSSNDELLYDNLLFSDDITQDMNLNEFDSEVLFCPSIFTTPTLIDTLPKTEDLDLMSQVLSGDEPNLSTIDSNDIDNYNNIHVDNHGNIEPSSGGVSHTLLLLEDKSNTNPIS